MYSKIAVIGLGTIGGFLVKHLSEISEIKEIIVVDYDEVVSKNISNSVYRNHDIGKLKTKAIAEIIAMTNEKVKITQVNSRFIEGECELPECDLVIDCRDFTYDRKDLIDIRLFISSRSLFIDGRKNVFYESHREGRYNTILTKLEFISAAAITTRLIESGSIDKIIQRKDLVEIDLEHFEQQVSRVQDDILYESMDCGSKLLNVPESLGRILELNKQKDVTLCINDIESSPVTKTIPRNSFRNSIDVVQQLSELIPKSLQPYNSYIISVKNIKNNSYVVLIPESGAA